MQTAPRPLPTIEAALSGFRLVWERPRAVAVWSVVCLAFNLGEALLVAATAGPAVERVIALAQQANPDPRAVPPLLMAVWPACLAVLLMTMALFAILLPALNRAMQRGGKSELTYLRLGRDEARQLILVVTLCLVALAAYLVLVVVGSLIGAILTIAGAASIGLAAAVVLVACGMGFVWVRFSLASPAAFSQGRIDLSASWGLTRGRFWALARIHLLALGLGGAAYLLGLVVILTLAQAMGVASQSDLTSPWMVLTPSHLLLRLLDSGLTALVLPVLLCPAIEIHRQVGVAAPSAPTTTAPWA